MAFIKVSKSYNVDTRDTIFLSEIRSAHIVQLDNEYTIKVLTYTGREWYYVTAIGYSSYEEIKTIFEELKVLLYDSRKHFPRIIESFDLEQ